MARHLVRTRQGTMIHKDDCGHAQNVAAVPWDWADTVSAVVINAAVIEYGYDACRHCKPLDL